MRKRQRIILLILLLLGGLTTFMMLRKKKKSTIAGEVKDFAVKDTSTIDKIFIAQKSGNTALLERKGKGPWTINGRYLASSDPVNTLLYTFLRTQVKYPAGDNAKRTIIRSIATNGFKAEVYQNGVRTKIWYVGAATPDHLGTFMVLADPETDEKYEEAFVTWIPGFEGFLSSRFFTDEGLWRDRTVVNATPNDFASLQLNYTSFPDSSFRIQVKGPNSFAVQDLQGNNFLLTDTLAVKQYLSYFLRLECVGFIGDGREKKLKDSVLKTTPFVQLELKYKSGKSDLMKFYHKKAESGKNDATGKKLPYDPDNAFIQFNNGKDLGLVQYLVFGKLFQTSAYFKGKSVKK